MRIIGDADAARLGNSLKARGDVDSVAENIVVVDDDIADVNADPKLDPEVLRHVGVSLAISRWISTAQRAASTALANSTSMPSPVVLTIRPRCAAIAGSTSVFRNDFSLRKRAFLVATHQPAIAGDIRRQHSRQSPFHALAGQKGPRIDKICLAIKA